METVNIAEAQANLSSLIARANAGEEIIIAEAGEPVARLVACEESAPKPPKSREPRKPGGWEGQVWMAPDFDETPQELIDAFENSPLCHDPRSDEEAKLIQTGVFLAGNWRNPSPAGTLRTSRG